MATDSPCVAHRWVTCRPIDADGDSGIVYSVPSMEKMGTRFSGSSLVVSTSSGRSEPFAWPFVARLAGALRLVAAISGRLVDNVDGRNGPAYVVSVE